MINPPDLSEEVTVNREAGIISTVTQNSDWKINKKN